MDWMMEVSEEFMLKRESYAIACHILDLYLSRCQEEIPKNQLQLLGVTSLFLSTKIDEVYLPRVSDFALATDGGYTKKEILGMEKRILSVLQWKIHPVTYNFWLNQYMNLWDEFSNTKL